MTKWYDMKERSAGALMLYVLWIIYKYFGKFCLKFVVFFVALISFFFASEIRFYSAKYFAIISDFSKQTIKPTFFNLFKHYLSYAYSLCDDIEIFSANFSANKMFFENKFEARKLFENFDGNDGVFFICNHLGNINAMRAFIFSDFKYSKLKINVFLQTNQTKIFDNFLRSISAQNQVKLYPVEEIGVDTAIEIHDNLKNGEVVFMAGDRVSAQSDTTLKATLFDKTIQLPKGTFSFAVMSEVPVYFVSCVKVQNDSYKIILKKADLHGNNKKEVAQNLAFDFVKFLETNTIKYPFQFYHFYDLFNEDYR